MFYPVHIKQGNIYSGYNLSNVGNIDELPTAASVSRDDLLIINDGTESKKASVRNVVDAGLKLVKLDSSNFSWSNAVNAFIYSYRQAVEETGLNTVVTWFVTSEKASGTIFGVNVNSENYVRVLGWYPKTATSIDGSTDPTSFSVYAIGY